MRRLRSTARTVFACIALSAAGLGQTPVEIGKQVRELAKDVKSYTANLASREERGEASAGLERIEQKGKVMWQRKDGSFCERLELEVQKSTQMPGVPPEKAAYSTIECGGGTLGLLGAGPR